MYDKQTSENPRIKFNINLITLPKLQDADLKLELRHFNGSE